MLEDFVADVDQINKSLLGREDADELLSLVKNIKIAVMTMKLNVLQLDDNKASPTMMPEVQDIKICHGVYGKAFSDNLVPKIHYSLSTKPRKAPSEGDLHNVIAGEATNKTMLNKAKLNLPTFHRSEESIAESQTQVVRSLHRKLLLQMELVKQVLGTKDEMLVSQP